MSIEPLVLNDNRFDYFIKLVMSTKYHMIHRIDKINPINKVNLIIKKIFKELIKFNYSFNNFNKEI